MQKCTSEPFLFHTPFRWAVQAMLRILGEDKAMVETLRPDLLPREVSVKVRRQAE